MSDQRGMPTDKEWLKKIKNLDSEEEAVAFITSFDCSARQILFELADEVEWLQSRVDELRQQNRELERHREQLLSDEV